MSVKIIVCRLNNQLYCLVGRYINIRSKIVRVQTRNIARTAVFDYFYGVFHILT